MRSMLIALVVLVGLVLPAGAASADEPDDPTHIQDCRRVLFLHWVDYSRHYVCVDTDPEQGGCHVSYTRDAPDGSTTMCLV